MARHEQEKRRGDMEEMQAKDQTYLITTKWAQLILLQLGTPFHEHLSCPGSPK